MCSRILTVRSPWYRLDSMCLLGNMKVRIKFKRKSIQATSLWLLLKYPTSFPPLKALSVTELPKLHLQMSDHDKVNSITEILHAFLPSSKTLWELVCYLRKEHRKVRSSICVYSMFTVVFQLYMMFVFCFSFPCCPFWLQEKQTVVQHWSTSATPWGNWWCNESSSLRRKRVKPAQVSQNS